MDTADRQAGKGGRLPMNLRRLVPQERLERLANALGLSDADLRALVPDEELLDLADAMVESAVGVWPVPLGVAVGLPVDGERRDIPLATEEPSVVAALTFAGRLVARGGGLETWASEPVMTAQVFVAEADADAEQTLRDREEEIAERLAAVLPSLTTRGGGYRGMETRRLPDSGLLRIHLHIDVRDAMGANVLDTAAESLRESLAEWTGGWVLMSILTNGSRQRTAGAGLRVPVEVFAGAEMDGAEVAQRIALASAAAQEDPERAVTHNKGIMNGISALARATGNDARAVEAAAHAWACRDGVYRGLSTFAVEDGSLSGRLEMPLPMATVGGAVGVHPAARVALRILGQPDAVGLSRIAAAVGLAQNLAALRALVSEGIQQGHMRYHAKRLAYQAGARGEEIRRVADALTEGGVFRLEQARRLLAQQREGGRT